MRGNKKILVVAVLLLLIAASYGTYAIYKTSKEGTATVTAAAWTVQFKNGATELVDNFTVTFDTADCVNTHVANGKIAPGAKCTKDITLLATGTEVDVTYEVSAGTITAEKGGSAVSTSGANEFTATLTDTTGATLDGQILMSDNPMSETLRVTVTWAGTEGTPDSADTALNGATISVPLTLVAKQMVNSTP